MIRGDWSFRNIARWERQLATAIRRWRTLATRGWQQDRMRRHRRSSPLEGPREILHSLPGTLGIQQTQSMNLRRSLLFDGKRNSEESENGREPDPSHGHLGCECYLSGGAGRVGQS